MILAEEHVQGTGKRKSANKVPLHASPMTPDHWDFGGEREPLMHRIHAYPAKFPAFITPKAVAYAQARGFTVNRIADIFCGCGTVRYFVDMHRAVKQCRKVSAKNLTPYRDTLGRFSTDAASRQVYAEETSPTRVILNSKTRQAAKAL